MAAPAWTAREWRPLASDLCAKLLEGPASRTGDGEHSGLARKRQQKLLLRADKVVANMYSHKYMDVTPQQIAGEVEEIAAKMQVHMLPERAQRLRELAHGCDYRVVKLLIELADAPTRASDDRVAVDLTTAPSEALQAWDRLLTPNKEKLRALQKARDEAAYAARLEEELLQVAWEDDWWKERMDDDGDDLDDALDDDSEADMTECGDDDWSGEISIATWVLAAEGATEKPIESENVEMEERENADDASTDEEEDQGDLLVQYYGVRHSREESRADVMAVETETLPEEQPESSILSFETPSQLLPHIQAHKLSMEKPGPRRIVHEQVVVNAIFFALFGVESALFELRPQHCEKIFNGDLAMRECILTSLIRRGIAVSHLSPLALVGIVQETATAATNLQFLRDMATFLSTSLSDDHRSLVAEGVSKELFAFVRKCQGFIDQTRCKMEEATRGIVLNEDSDDDKVFGRKSILLPTLLGSRGAFKEMNSTLSWLCTILKSMMTPFEARSRDTVAPSHLAATILSGLYESLRLTYAEFSQPLVPSLTLTPGGWDRYDILCGLFEAAFSPYLDAIDQMVFERGFGDRIPLHPELFFAPVHNPARAALSPRANAQKVVEETFDDAMTMMMPFRVDRLAVPAFLAPLIPKLSAALESRHIMNHYLRQHHTAEKPETEALSKLFQADLKRLVSVGSQYAPGCQFTPFTEVVRQSVLKHVQERCDVVNGAIANLFREKLHLQEHANVVRLFLLMHQQDTFTSLSQYLIEQMQVDPVGWARTELLNTAFQDAIHNLHTEGLLTNSQREIAARLSIRVDTNEIERLRITRHIDISALRCLQFRFSTPQPLRVLFSGSIVHKYSTLAILLLQVKVAELMLTTFKQSFRHRLCFLQTNELLRSQLVRVADMLHYTRAVLNYLANQMTGDAWMHVERVFKESKSLREINDAHDEYLDKMLNSFFLLKKHEGFTRQFMQNFNDVIIYVSRVDDFVRTVERDMNRFFDVSEDNHHTQGRGGVGGSRRDLVPNEELRTLYSKLQRSLRNPDGSYESQLQVITIVLDAMVKNGASPHVNELLLLLTFNGFRTPSKLRPTTR